MAQVALAGLEETRGVRSPSCGTKLEARVALVHLILRDTPSAREDMCFMDGRVFIRRNLGLINIPTGREGRVTLPSQSNRSPPPLRLPPVPANTLTYKTPLATRSGDQNCQ